MGKSHSSSLSSLGEIAASDKRNYKLQTEARRVLSQVSYVVHILSRLTKDFH